MRKINKGVIVHHTAGSIHDSVADIRRFHVEKRGYNDIGYHALISPDGHIAPGRPVWKVGAHCKWHNTGTLGLCFIGYYHPPLNQAVIPAQLKSAAVQIAEWASMYGFSPSLVFPHSKFGATACPGDRIRERIPEIIRMANAEFQKLKGGK